MGILKDFEKQIQSVNPNFEYRPSQDEGSEMVYSMVEDKEGGVVLLEGPCGFGKTYAYLIPLLKDVVRGGTRKVVVVTDGIALQEQLYQKDIPAVLRILGKEDLVSTMLKGRNNYLCKSVYEESVFTTQDNLTAGVNSREEKEQIETMQKWAKETRTGDTSELPFIAKPEVAGKFLLLDGDDCTGAKCDYYSDCFYYKNRLKAVNESDIVVTNYHYLFTAAETGHRQDMLPAGEISYVFDEAHQAVDIFRNYTETKFTTKTLNKIMTGVKSISKSSTYYSNIFKYDGGLPDRIVESSKNLSMGLIQLKLDLFHDYNTSYLIEEIAADTMQKKGLQKFLDLIETTYAPLSMIVESVLEAMSEMDSSQFSTEDQKDFGKTIQALKKVREIIDLRQILIDHLENGIGDDVCVWVEHDRDGDTSEIHSKAIDVGERIREHFFTSEENKTYGGKFFMTIPPRVVITSATLSTGSNFTFIKGELGVTDEIKTYEFIGESPFDLTSQQLWYLPEGAIEGNKKEFQEYFVKETERILNATKGGGLCLFTSYANLRKAYETLNRRLRMPFDMIRQGDAPKAQLIRLFANDPDSTLFGTRSFFTGVDVPGPSLRCVIIDKLPFAMQGDPVIRKISKRPRSFYSFSIPSMIMTLKQAIGRGVRSKDDKCVIAILDNRMSSASYKSVINGSFSYKKTGTRDLATVEDYINEYMAVAKPYVQTELPKLTEDIAGTDENEGDSDFPFSFDEFPF